MKKRLFALLLVVVLMLCIAPVESFAANSVKKADGTDAKNGTDFRTYSSGGQDCWEPITNDLSVSINASTFKLSIGSVNKITLSNSTFGQIEFAGNNTEYTLNLNGNNKANNALTINASNKTVTLSGTGTLYLTGDSRAATIASGCTLNYSALDVLGSTESNASLDSLNSNVELSDNNFKIDDTICKTVYFTPKITIADILPDDFPTSTVGAWLNAATGGKSYIMNGNLFVFGKTNVELSKSVTKKDDGNYEYKGTSGTIITFVMESGKLTEINVSGSVYSENNGTYVAPHTHAFTYTANNGKLTATCVDGCDKGYDTTPLTLTLTAPASFVYDGNAKAFTFADGEADAWTGAGLELPTITYYQKYSGQELYTQLDEVPVNAGGDYMAEILVNDKAAQVKFTIDKATPYIKTTPAPNDIEYGEKLFDSTLFGGYVQVSSTNTTQVGGLFEWTNPDTVPGIEDSEVTLYDVTYTPADETNYNTVSCKVKIRVNHTHTPESENGQAPTESASGWKDYYKCICGEYYEDAIGNVKIPDLDAWKAEGGNGYIAPLVHSITPVNGKNATDTEAGYKAYYECKNCGKYYEDAAGLIEITDIDEWKAEGGNGYIAKLEPTPDPINYKVIEGANSVWTVSAGESPVFRSNADFSKFSHVLLDGKELAKKYYKAESGSTIVTLKPEYAATLSVGKHTIEIVSTDGSAATVFYIEETIAQTDGEGFALSTAATSIAFIGCNIGGLAVVFFELKKKKKVR